MPYATKLTRFEVEAPLSTCSTKAIRAAREGLDTSWLAAAGGGGGVRGCWGVMCAYVAYVRVYDVYINALYTSNMQLPQTTHVFDL